MVRNKITGLLLLATVALTACQPDEVKRQYSFNATMEQLRDADNPGSKVRLHNEEWTYWEYGDQISVISDAATEMADAWLTGSSSDYENYNGVFGTTLTEEEGKTSTYFVGLHPMSENNVLTSTYGNSKGFTAKVFLNGTQHYRDDSSYAKQVLPMVAWYGGQSWEEDGNPPRLDFHSLAGLVRLQLINSTGDTRYITRIELESIDGSGSYTRKRLHGLFPVKNLYSFNSFLGDSNVTDATEATLTLSMEKAEGGRLTFAPNDLKSFYIVLPAYHGMDTSDGYHLRMTVYTDAGSFQKSFSVRTRRNGITYLRAISITNFSNGSDNHAVLVGNGTSTRPFKIYTAADLVYLRDCFATNGTVRVNGQEVTRNTYFRIMRSDINLSPSNWSSGISGFKGHMTYYANVSNYHDTTALTGITNNSLAPLFASISEDGTVDGIAIRCDSTINVAGGITHSPLCGTNSGLIINCHVGKQAANRSLNYMGGSALAGICGTNYSTGRIERCGCSLYGVTRSSIEFAGICHTNHGTITGCFAASPLQVTASAHSGGICHDNQGTIQDCYFAARITNDSRPWGGIVYNNQNGGTVKNCYFGDGSVISSDTVGGIACLNSGTVNYCWCDGQLSGDKVGGIAATVNSGGILTNCYINDSALNIIIRPTGTRHLGGGLAAEVRDGGKIYNSYVVMDHFTHPTGSTFGSVVGYIHSTAEVNNCYGVMTGALEPYFYGGKEGESTDMFTNCYLIHGSYTQSGSTRVDVSSSAETTLATTLNGTRGNYAEWERPATPTSDHRTPTLKAYTHPTPRAKSHRRR